MKLYGGVEGGVTKWVSAVGTGPDDLRAETTIPTTTPAETLGTVVRFLSENGPVDAVGIGSLGPIDRDPASSSWGSITTTAKPGWVRTDVAPSSATRWPCRSPSTPM